MATYLPTSRLLYIARHLGWDALSRIEPTPDILLFSADEPGERRLTAGDLHSLDESMGLFHATTVQPRLKKSNTKKLLGLQPSSGDHPLMGEMLQPVSLEVEQLKPFGRLVRQYRTHFRETTDSPARKMSQKELGSRVGCTFETIRKIEAGETQTSKHFIPIVSVLSIRQEALPKSLRQAISDRNLTSQSVQLSHSGGRGGRPIESVAGQMQSDHWLILEGLVRKYGDRLVAQAAHEIATTMEKAAGDHP